MDYDYSDWGNRAGYLESLADDYGVPLDLVQMTADMLGEIEDFDGLVSSLEDFGMGF